MSITAADALRPQDFDGYIGQDRMKAELNVRIQSANQRSAHLAHTLLIGPAGAGKTTMAQIIANMMGMECFTFEFPFSDEDYKKLREAYGVIFIDEIHRGTTAQKEELLALTEHARIRPRGKSMIEWEDGLTVIGATTEPGKVLKPLRDRFLVQPFFDDYSDDEMARIGLGMGNKLGVEMSYDESMILGKASAGTPRKISHFMTAARDLQEVNGSLPTAVEVLDFVRHTHDGLNPNHIQYLTVLWKQSPLGLNALRQMIEMDESGIMDLERLLMKLNFIEKTAKGRELSTSGYRRIKEILKGDK